MLLPVLMKQALTTNATIQISKFVIRALKVKVSYQFEFKNQDNIDKGYMIYLDY